MQNLAIKVSNLGKAYRIGVKEKKQETLAGAIMSALKAPLKNYKRISNLKKLQGQQESPDIFWANRHVNFEVHKGEVLGIIGKNGAGKSTLLKMLSRITEPTEGRIEIHGTVASLLEVGTGFNPDLTGSENIYLNGTILGLTRKEIDARYNDIVEFSGIEKFMETPVKRYSSGMKVRLAFAVAAHLDPEILIIDEVLAVGDAEFQKKCLGKMQEVAGKTGRTVLFVSHDMAAVKNLCTRAILLQRGEITYEGEPGDVVDYYLKNAAMATSEKTGFSLENRKGNGKFVVTNFEFLNSKMEPVVVLETGMDVNMRVSYKTSESNPNPVVNILISNSYHQVIGNLLTRIAHNGVLRLQKEGSIVCNIPKLPFLPGRYSIDILLKYDYDVTDHIEGLTVMEVEKGDFYGTGKVQDAMKDGMLVDHNWAVEKQSVLVNEGH
jgi:lipopolysaccharide transport system ATP-binding protein